LAEIIKRLLRKDDSAKVEFRRNRKLAIHQGESSSPGTDEYVEQAARIGAVIMDPVTTQVLLDNEYLHGLIPVLSPQNSLINAPAKEQRLMRIRLENQIKLLKITMPYANYNADGLEILQGYRYNGHARITGMTEGFIGKMATQFTKVHRFEETKESK
jgi:hypothetical protein